jgi:hypothetical protein
VKQQKEIHDRKENKRQRGENKIHKLCVCIAHKKIAMEGPRHTQKKIK